jgi:hypothetical protein
MLLLLSLACPKEGPIDEPAGPTMGWTIEEGWSGACFVPPAFDQLEGDVLVKQQEDTLAALHGQWTGQRKDGVRFDDDAADAVVRLLPPEGIEKIALINLGYCRDFMSSEASTAGWSSWLEEVAEDLEREHCPEPLEDTYLTLDVSDAWFAEVPLCVGTEYVVKSGGDPFRTSADGPMHGIDGYEGDASALPCPECPVGALIARFDGEDGSSETMALNSAYSGVAPVAGVLSIGLNDVDHSDNAYEIQGGVQGSVSIQVSPKRD